MNMKTKDTILTISNVSKSFPGVKALDNVSIEVHKGTVHGIVGENGAGKSTLMKILSGVYQKDSGTIVFDGKTIESTTPHQAMQMGLSIIYQELNLVNTMTVGENIFLGRFKEMKGMRGTHLAAAKLLQSISCDIDTNRLVAELSVSQKQMVEITKALSFDSKLIIMDEPSSSLTSDEMKELVQIIHQLKAKGISIIYISHKLDEIFDFCDEVTVMRDGKVVDNKPIAEISRNEMISLMVGRSIENEFPERPRCAGEVLMQVRSIRTKKLDDISFDLHKGEILGLVGLVGAGRTEIVRALFAADKVKGHEVLIEGMRVEIKTPRDAIKVGMGFVPEDRKLQGLVLPFSVESNISMASLERISHAGFVNKKKERDIAERQIKAFGIKTPSSRTRVKSLSGGNQQKCIVGRWMELNPRILIMDEPTRGIDVGAKYDIYLLMKQIVEHGGSVILISSELPEVLNMSNRVITICDGRITGEFDPEKATADEIMAKAFEFENEGMGACLEN
jgi:ribose transport system ATP-binding protein